jgi:two-component system, NtrC family, response regulator AtoC
MAEPLNTRTTVTDPEVGPNAGGEGVGLLVVSAESVSAFPLPSPGSVLIGRATECDVPIDDPLISRRHARLHVGLGAEMAIEDLASANGTRVREDRIAENVRVPIGLGESIGVGSAVLVVQPVRQPGGVRRIWAHRWFESRLRDECARCQADDDRFALVRIALERPAPWPQLVPILDRSIPAPHLFAAYGPNDYEIIAFADDSDQLTDVLDPMRKNLAASGLDFSMGVAFYPRDGRTSDALMTKANRSLRLEPGPSREPLSPTISPAMQKVHLLAEKAARSAISVLIVGETGVGKEVLAQRIHALSPRSGRDILALNCAGLSQTLIESDLFGHEKGAFTGANQAKKGLFEAAEGGTLFLDEVGEMPLSVQAKLLRAIANREVLPVGAVKPRSIDVRIIAATNRDLDVEIRENRFRQDLYYRLNGILLYIPPLRERREEILGLARLFLELAVQGSKRSPPALTDAAARMLQGHDWRGNIRELRNIIERATILSETDVIDLEHLPVDRMITEPAPVRGASPASPTRLMTALSREELAERQRLIAALEANVWNQSRAARSLNMHRRTFVTKLERYGIPRPQKGSTPPDSSSEPDQ